MPLYFADECVPQGVVDGLTARGFDVVDAKLVCRGDTDERLLSLAASAGRVVVTDDWGFGEMTVRRGAATAGVIILSLYHLPVQRRVDEAVARIIDLGEKAVGQLSIIEPGRVRTRTIATP